MPWRYSGSGTSRAGLLRAEKWAWFCVCFDTQPTPLKIFIQKTCQSIKNALARSHFSCGRFSFLLRLHSLLPVQDEVLKQKNIRWRLKNQPPLFLLVYLIRYDGQNRNHHRYPFSETHIFSFLSGYEARQTALAGSSVVPLDMSSKAQRYSHQKPQSAQSAGIRHAFLLKAPSSSSNSAGASCGSVSMTRLVCGSKVAMFEHMMPSP